MSAQEDRKLQKHLVDEMMKVSETNPDVMFYMEALMKKYEELEQKVEQLEKENDKLKHKLNDIAFGDDSELALRFLRRIGYVGFDEKRKVYINKHNNEPFLWKDEQEKDYYLKDEELNEYTQQLEYKVEQLENIRKEATEYINHATIGADSSPIEDSWLYNLYETKHILNKGSEKDVKKNNTNSN